MLLVSLATAVCCRNYTVDASRRIGKCGICGTVPQVISNTIPVMIPTDGVRVMDLSMHD